MNKILITGVLLTAAVQVAIPAAMLQGRERTLREGEVFRFQSAPVDPYDAFRGRYVRLSVASPQVPLEGEPLNFRRKQRIFATLAIDTNGFAFVTAASRARPETGAYVRAEAWGRSHDGRVTVRLPIDRYYMPEYEAPAAERAYMDHARRDRESAVVVARVRNGDLVVEDVLVEGKPLRAWVAEQTDAQ